MNKVGVLLEEEGFEHMYCTAHSLQLTAVLAFDAGIFPGEDNEPPQPKEVPPAAAAAASRHSSQDDESSSDSDDQLASWWNDKPAADEGEGDLKPAATAPEEDDFNVEKVDQAEKKAKTLLYKARRIVQYFNKSTQALAELRKCYDRLWIDKGGPVSKKLADGWVLKQDVITRWWSTYTMLDRLLCLHVPTAIGNYYNENGGFQKTKAKSKIENLTLEDWEALRQLKELLQPFKNSQKILEGNKYITASLTPLVMATLQMNLKHSAEKKVTDNNKSVIECAKVMREDHNTRLGDVMKRPFSPEVERAAKNRQVGVHPAYLIAHALDPRFKSLKLFESDSIREAIWNHILELMVDIKYNWEMEQARKEQIRQTERELNRNRRKAPPGTDTAQVPPVAEVTTVEDDSDEEMDPGMAALMSRLGDPDSAPPPQRRQSPTKSSIRAAMKMQLEDYRRSVGLEVPANKAHEHDPLKEWWEEHHTAYPELWKLAEKYLAIPATSAPSERAFSSAGIVLSIRRCRLKPNLVSDSVLLRENRHIVKHHANISLFDDEEGIEFVLGVGDESSTLT
jgi:hypothetical protein